ncbi:hypothetical protein C0J52_14941 [Blattella germanica]|nr:hypothetical protein C0J52_14941 [Blattella germanica]
MPEGTRKIRRPKTRWEDSVGQDVRILGIQNWRSTALDRQKWRELPKKARVHIGLRCR